MRDSMRRRALVCERAQIRAKARERSLKHAQLLECLHAWPSCAAAYAARAVLLCIVGARKPQLARAAAGANTYTLEHHVQGHRQNTARDWTLDCGKEDCLIEKREQASGSPEAEDWGFDAAAESDTLRSLRL
eukprot:6202788-Pleurochrysis_carterae.AAC.1